MTNPFDRRIRKLNANALASSQSAVVLVLPGQLDRDSVFIGPDDILVSVSFVAACGGRLAEEGCHACH